MFYVVHSVGLIIATSHKCASTSIRTTFLNPYTKDISEIAALELKKACWRIVGVVRDPIDRFESAYNFFRYGGTFNKTFNRFPTGIYSTIEQFTDAVLEGAEDSHWLPQSKMLKHCGLFIDLETLPLPVIENAVEHLETVKYRRGELIKYYFDDYKIRGGNWRDIRV